jgi:hypothetical protein
LALRDKLHVVIIIMKSVMFYMRGAMCLGRAVSTTPEIVSLSCLNCGLAMLIGIRGGGPTVVV